MPVDYRPTSCSPWFPPAWHMVTTPNPNTARRKGWNGDRFASCPLFRCQSTIHAPPKRYTNIDPHTGITLCPEELSQRKNAGNRPFWGLCANTRSTLLRLPSGRVRVFVVSIKPSGSSPQRRPMGSHLPHEPLSIIPGTLHACRQ